MFKKILQSLRLLNHRKTTIHQRDANERDLELENKLIEVASAFEDWAQFQLAAQKVASELDYGRASSLVKYFHNTPPEPEKLKPKTAKYGVLGVWMNIIQNAIFEILYNYKAAAIPQLYYIGFGVYDWTQYKAIAVLARLAADGIQTDEIVANIGKELPNFRYEAFFPSIESLAKIKNNAQVAIILKQAFDDYANQDPIDALYILRMMAMNYSQEAKKELNFLKKLASSGQGLENHSLLKDGAVMIVDANDDERFFVNGKEVEEGNFDEAHRINAALLFHYLEPNDPKINAMIDYWALNAVKESDRAMIAAYKRRE